jgi:hypothetical protein
MLTLFEDFFDDELDKMISDDFRRKQAVHRFGYDIIIYDSNGKSFIDYMKKNYPFFRLPYNN